MTVPPDKVIEAWTKLLRAHRVALSSVESALKAAGYPPLGWYDVLLELERAGARGLRPMELEAGLLLPQYSVSRLIERIEKQGLLRRESCEDDGRGQRLFLTAGGKRLRQEMWPVYARAIDAAVGSKLTAAQARTLANLLAKLVD